MRKKTLCMILALVMVFSLLPGFALNAAAAEGAVQVGETQKNEKEGLHLEKSLWKETDGTYTVKLESWATGNKQTINSSVPTDIVLVVDLSFSMRMAEDARTHINYKDVTDENGDPMFRIEAAVPAIKDFIQTVYDANKKGADFRMAIVSFSGETSFVYVFDGTKYTAGSSAKTSDYQNALKKVDDEGKAKLESSLTTSPFTKPEGQYTVPDSGLKQAENVLNARTDAWKDGELVRESAIVMFTDGFPGSNEFGFSKYADPAIQRATNLKQGKNQSSIYTIGLFGFDDSMLMHYQYDSPSDTGTYSVAEYMKHVSSEYSSSTLVPIPGYSNPDAKKPTGTLNPDGKQYYYHISSSDEQGATLADLKEIFKNIATDIATTDVKLTEEAVLKDQINTLDFSVPAGAVEVKASTVDAVAVDSNQKITWGTTETPLTGDFWDAATNTAKVPGFNYSTEYTTYVDGSPEKDKLGKKLIVTITGLIPKHDGLLKSNGVAGIYSEDTEVVPFVDVMTPEDTISHRTYVIDFNAKMKLAENALLNDNGVLKNEITGTNGNFTKDGTTVSYQLKPDVKVSEDADISFSGVDSALVFGNFYKNTERSAQGKAADTGAKQWLKVNAVPAASVYFDDAVMNKDVVVGDGTGYNVGVTSAPATSQRNDKSTRTITFTGTGIDVYATTDSASGWITANLYEGDTVPAMDSNTETNQAYKSQIMKNNSVDPHNGCPTIRFNGLPYNTYTLTLNTSVGSNYRFEGVRVYRPADAEAQTYYDDVQKLPFTRVRDILLNEPDFAKAVKGDKDAAGVIFTEIRGNDNNPAETTTADVTTYEKNGPRGEVYLDKNEAIAFHVDTTDEILVGMSSVDGNAVTYAVSNGDETPYSDTITATVDMYYKVKPNSSGYVCIKNNSDTAGNLLAITNIRAATDNGAEAFSVSQDVLDYVVRFDTLLKTAGTVKPDTDPVAPDETQPVVVTPAQDEVKPIWNDAGSVQKLLTAMWRTLLDSMSKLFAGLSRW